MDVGGGPLIPCYWSVSISGSQSYKEIVQKPREPEKTTVK